MKYLFSCVLLLVFGQIVFAQTPTSVKYPFPVKYLSLNIEKQNVKIAYMDVAPKMTPQMPDGTTVILFHGKNFNGYYWKNVIPMLTSRGFRVIVPDQIGWGKSDRPTSALQFSSTGGKQQKTA